MAAVKDVKANLKVKIFSPYQVFYQGAAVSVSGNNKTGPFDVLVNHSNFFSLLPPSILQVNTGYEKVKVQINSGFMKVDRNTITVFANV
jgi:F0F1-type ATP synthase epsilon subunit